MSNAALTRHLKANPMRVEKVDLKGWNEPLYLREMDAEAMAEFMRINQAGQDDASFSVARAIDVICLHLCDEKGTLSSEGSGAEMLAQALKRLKFAEVTELFSACMRASGLSAAEVEAAEGN